MYTVLLPPIREPLLDDHWRNFLVLNGTYPNMAAAAAANASVPPTVSPYDVVKWSIQGWNASVWNTSSNSYMQSPTWPYPEGTKAQGWMSMVQQILQRCITDEEAVQLEADNLLDCSTLGRQRACASTCTDTVSGSLYFFRLHTRVGLCADAAGDCSAAGPDHELIGEAPGQSSVSWVL